MKAPWNFKFNKHRSNEWEALKQYPSTPTPTEYSMY